MFLYLFLSSCDCFQGLIHNLAGKGQLHEALRSPFLYYPRASQTTAMATVGPEEMCLEVLCPTGRVPLCSRLGASSR